MKKVVPVLVGSLALGLAACSDGADEAERALVVEWLIDHDESPEAAECLADELAAYDVADFDALAAISDGSGVDEAFSAAVIAAMEICSDA